MFWVHFYEMLFWKLINVYLRKLRVIFFLKNVVYENKKEEIVGKTFIVWKSLKGAIGFMTLNGLHTKIKPFSEKKRS